MKKQKLTTSLTLSPQMIRVLDAEHLRSASGGRMKITQVSECEECFSAGFSCGCDPSRYTGC